jgi:hypothetical protein
MNYDDPPFALGETYKGTDSEGNLINTDLEGRDYTFPITEAVAGALGLRDRTTGRVIKARIFRNISGAVMYGKRVANVTPSSLDACTKATGPASVEGDKYVFPVDPYLGSGGVADDDLFYGIIAGPTTLLTSSTAADEPLSAGDEVMVADDANGRICKAVEFNDVSSAYSGLRHSLGTSLTNRGPNELSAEVVVDISLAWAS